jgi:hypothetical protein
MEIARRLGLPPKSRDSNNDGSCPDIFELTDGRFAIIGTDETDGLLDRLPADARCAPYERIVVIDRATLLAAKADIPDGL